jgi:serine/threonine protein kinase
MKFCPQCERRFDDKVSNCPDDDSPLMSVPQTDLTDQVVAGRFKIVRKLGEGGMGTVYQAFQFSVNREVALKVMRRELADSEQSIKRFMREAQAASKLRNPNTITVFDFGQTEDGLLYMALEFLKGKPLDRVLAREAPLSVSRTAHILGQICNSLEEAHAEGIVHRDLKPPNLVVENRAGFRDFVTVLDFGIARVADDETDEVLTQTGTVIGSPRYMSPEQVQGQKVDARSDLYSLGIIAYEMLSGRAPFEGGTKVTVMTRHCTEAPKPLSQVNPGLGIPPALDHFLQVCLAKDPNKRPATAAEFKSRLQLAISGTIESPAVVSDTTEIAPLTSEELDGVETPLDPTADTAFSEEVVVPEKVATPNSPPAAPAAAETAPRRRARWALGFGALVVVAAAIFAIFMFVIPPGEEASPPVDIWANLPQRPLLAIVPLASAPDRTVDKALWPNADRTIFNSCQELLDEGTSGLVLVDPLAVQDAARARELTGAIAAEDARELATALAADLVLMGKLTRVEGKLVLDAQLLSSSGDGVLAIEGTGKDLFAASASLAQRLIDAAPEIELDMTAGALPEGVSKTWSELLGDPWTEARYSAFALAAQGSGDEGLAAFATALSAPRGKANDCPEFAASFSEAYPADVGPLGEALCHGRRLDFEAALAVALDAFREVKLRRRAGTYITKIDSQSRSAAQREAFLDERVQLFPDDLEAWWMLALLRATGDSPSSADPAVKVASALSLGQELSFPVALNAVRTTMQLGDFEQSQVWMEKLERAPVRSDWDVLWRACRKSGLEQLRGRSGDGQKELELARRKLLKAGGDPYTIAATTLFYSYLQSDMLADAAAIVEEYVGIFEGTEKPDRFTARLLQLGLDHKQGNLGKDEFVQQALAVAQQLEDAIGDGGKRERDAFLCLALAPAADAKIVADLARQADPANTMVAACRLVQAELDLKNGRNQQARAGFARVQSDILYRSDWSYEYYLRARLGEAAAAESLGDDEAARTIYTAIVSQYRNADRVLPELAAAEAALARLSPATN